MAYGFNLDEFEVISDTIKSGDSFGELMLEKQVDYPKIYELTQRYKDTFDVKAYSGGKALYDFEVKRHHPGGSGLYLRTGSNKLHRGGLSGFRGRL